MWVILLDESSSVRNVGGDVIRELHHPDYSKDSNGLDAILTLTQNSQWNWSKEYGRSTQWLRQFHFSLHVTRHSHSLVDVSQTQQLAGMEMNEFLEEVLRFRSFPIAFRCR